MRDYKITVEEAKELFKSEAFLMGDKGREAIPFYRLIDMFGDEVLEFLCKHMCYKGFLVAGEDHNAYGYDLDLVNYMYWSGFVKLISYHNGEIALKEELQSINHKKYLQMLDDRMAKLEQEEREEQKAKRKKAKANP